jgi:MFS family permease
MKPETHSKKDNKTASYATLSQDENHHDDDKHLDSKSLDGFVAEQGMGVYQYSISIFGSIFWLTYGMIAMAFANTQLVFQDIYGYSNTQVIIIQTVFFVGLLVGALITGRISDLYGRKSFYIIFSLMAPAFAMLSIITANFWYTIVFRFLAGCAFAGCIVLTVTVTVEISPKDYRGKILVLMLGCFPLGMVFSCLLASALFTTSDEGKWQLYVVLCAVPLVITFIGSLLVLRESPRWLFFNSSWDEGYDNLNLLFKFNEGTLFTIPDVDKEHLRNWREKEMGVDEQNSSDISALFQEKYKWITPLLWIFRVSLNVTEMGIIFAMPLTEATTADGTNNAGFYQIALMALGGVIAVVPSYFMIESPMFGRKNSIIICFAGGSIALFVAYAVRGMAFTIMICITQFFFNPAYGFVYPFVGEVYHTKIRSTGLGCAESIASVGAIVAPGIAIELVKVSPYFPYLIFAIVSLIGAIATFLIPYDTTGRNLDGINPDDVVAMLTQHHDNPPPSPSLMNPSKQTSVEVGHTYDH